MENAKRKPDPRIPDIFLIIALFPSVAFAHGQGIAMFVIGYPLSVMSFIIASVIIKTLFIRKFVWIYWLIALFCTGLWSFVFILISATIFDSHLLDGIIPSQHQEVSIAFAIAPLPILVVLAVWVWLRIF